MKNERPKFTLSNNLSNSTLCVRVTCLKFGLRPLLNARTFRTGRDSATLRPSSASSRRFDIDLSKCKRKYHRSLQGKDAFINVIEQSDQPVLFLTSERSLGWDICDLRRGVNKLDLYHRVKVDPVKQPTKRNSVCAGNVSPRRTSAFHHHLVHRIVVFKDEQKCFVTGKLFVGRDKSQSPLSTASADFCDSLVVFDLATDFSVLECPATDFSVLWSATHQVRSPTNPNFPI